MAERPVVFNITTQGEKNLYNALQQAQQKADALQDKLDKAGKNGSDAFQGISKEITAVAGKLIGPMSIAAGVGAIVKAFSDEIAKAKEVAKEALNLHVSLAQAQANAFINVPMDFRGGRQGVESMVNRVSEKYKISAEDVWKNMQGLSAKGGLSESQYEDVLGLTTDLRRKTGQGLDAELSGRVMDVMKASNVSAMQGLGVILQAGQASRMENLTGQARMIPGLEVGKAFGDSYERSLEMQAAISQMITDKAGEQTASGYKNLVKDLAIGEILPYYKTNMFSGKKEMKFKRLSGANTDERIAEIQKAYAAANDDEKAEIVKKIGGEASMLPFIMGMLENSSSYQGNLKTAESQITAPASPETLKTAQTFLKNISGTTSAQIAQSQYERQAAVEAYKEKNSSLAIDAEARNIRADFLRIPMSDRYKKDKTARTHGDISSGDGSVYDWLTDSFFPDTALEGIGYLRGKTPAQTYRENIMSSGDMDNPLVKALIDRLDKLIYLQSFNKRDQTQSTNAQELD